MKITKRYIIKFGEAVYSEKTEAGELVPVTFKNRKVAEGAAHMLAIDTAAADPAAVTVGEAEFAHR